MKPNTQHSWPNLSNGEDIGEDIKHSSSLGKSNPEILLCTYLSYFWKSPQEACNTVLKGGYKKLTKIVHNKNWDNLNSSDALNL